MKNKLKTSKQGKLGKTNLKLQNKGHGGLRKKMQKNRRGSVFRRLNVTSIKSKGG